MGASTGTLDSRGDDQPHGRVAVTTLVAACAAQPRTATSTSRATLPASSECVAAAIAAVARTRPRPQPPARLGSRTDSPHALPQRGVQRRSPDRVVASPQLIASLVRPADSADSACSLTRGCLATRRPTFNGRPFASSHPAQGRLSRTAGRSEAQADARRLLDRAGRDEWKPRTRHGLATAFGGPHTRGGEAAEFGGNRLDPRQMAPLWVLLVMGALGSGCCWSKPEQVVAAEGLSVTLDCAVRPNFTEVTWKWIPHHPVCNGHADASVKFAARTLFRQAPPSSCSLELRDLKSSDTGSLLFEMPGGAERREVELVVRPACLADVVLRAEPHGAVTLGRSLVLSCQGSARALQFSRAVPTFVWWFKGNRVPPSRLTEDGSNITILAVSFQDLGLYTCSVNGLSKHTSEYCVNKDGKSNSLPACINVTTVPFPTPTSMLEVRGQVMQLALFSMLAACCLVAAVAFTACLLTRRGRHHRDEKDATGELNLDNAYESMGRAPDGRDVGQHNPIYENIDNVMKGNGKRAGETHELTVYEVMKRPLPGAAVPPPPPPPPGATPATSDSIAAVIVSGCGCPESPAYDELSGFKLPEPL
ncbi:unnamed protein product [Lampetra planeri]